MSECLQVKLLSTSVTAISRSSEMGNMKITEEMHCALELN